jgi:hypothetical protein
MKSPQKLPSNTRAKKKYAPFLPLDFSLINECAQSFANHIESHFEELADILLEYESFEVVKDEIARTLDVLTHLKENKNYFTLRIGQVTSFLPRNQPLYALTCFVVIPSLMASEVHFRIPHSMRHFFPEFLEALKLTSFFPNISISHKERLKFLEERSALRINPKTEESRPLTDVVIFTGTPNHAERLRLVFDRRTLFITNGAGHNPIVISETADVEKSVEAATKLQLYNQGQDCAAPNAILIHRKMFKPFMKLLREELNHTRVGHYRDRLCRVGPISDPDELVRIQSLFVENQEWMDPSTPGIIRTVETIVEPTIICKPLNKGGNFMEVFAPIFFVQQYDEDKDLIRYFESPHYARNAMYISLFGKSKYVDSLIDRPIEGKILHDAASVLRNTHPHEPGIERGTQPYGGYGSAASNLCINRQIICKPTLPQRDIYEQVVKPLLKSKKIEEEQSALEGMTKILKKDVQKLLSLKTSNQQEYNLIIPSGKVYIDSSDIIKNGRRYVEISSEQMFSLLSHPNAEHIGILEPRHVHDIRALHKFFRRKKFDKEELTQFLYAVAKTPNASDRRNRAAQLTFFQNIYLLLLGKDSGPRLGQFLMDASRDHVLSLLDI